MALQTVQKLSERKQKFSLGEVKRRENDKAQASTPRKSMRTTVVDPNDFEWPSISEEDADTLLDCLKSDLTVLKLPISKVPSSLISKVEKAERREYRNKVKQEQAKDLAIDIDIFKTLRSNVCLGVNSVSRSLEMNLLSAVIIDKDVEPQIITKLLIPIAKSKMVPIVALNGLSKVCVTSFKTRCLAIGFKHKCQKAENPFRRIHDLVLKISSDDQEIHKDSCISNELLPRNSKRRIVSTPCSSNEESNKGLDAKKEASYLKNERLLPPKIRKLANNCD